MPLTDKQARFVEEYLLDLNATQAAIRAGYSADTARSIGSENLTKPDVQDAIAAAKAERSARTKIDAAWVLQRLADEAEADVADLYTDDGMLKPVKEWPLIWRKGLVAGLDVEELFEGRGEDREHVGTLRKLRLSDRMKRIELIGKHVDVNAFRENVAHSNPDGTPLEATPARELAKAVALLLSKGLQANGGSGS